MNLIRRILVPTDFGEPALAALRYAVQLARGVGAEVSVLHVTPPSGGLGSMFAVRAPSRAKIEEGERKDQEQVEAVQARLERFARSVPRVTDVPVRLVVRSGSPEEEIPACAEEDRQDLLVLGVARPVGSLAHRLIGGSRLAERVLSESSCPVLLVRPDSGEQWAHAASPELALT